MSNNHINNNVPASSKEETNDVFEMMGIFSGPSVTELLQEVHVEINNPLLEVEQPREVK